MVDAECVMAKPRITPLSLIFFWLPEVRPDVHPDLVSDKEVREEGPVPDLDLAKVIYEPPRAGR